MKQYSQFEDQNDQILDPNQIRSDQQPIQVYQDYEGQNKNSNTVQQRKKHQSDVDFKGIPIHGRDSTFSKHSEGGLIQIEQHTQTVPEYTTYTILNSIASLIVIVLIKEAYTHSIMTSYEIVYAQCAICTFILFIYLLSKGIYVLDLDRELRVKVIIRGFLVFAGMILTYSSISRLTNLTTVLVVQYSCMCITQFFILKQERQLFTNVLAMSLALISFIMVFIQIVEPIADSNEMNLDKVIGFAQSGISGSLLAIISYLSQQTSHIRNEILQSFYANCICACFSPFFILKDISDRKKVTKYGIQELQQIALICLISLIQVIWLERKVIIRFIEGEGRKLVNFGFIKILLAFAIDYLYYGIQGKDQSYVNTLIGCSFSIAIAIGLITYGKDLLLNF